MKLLCVIPKAVDGTSYYRGAGPLQRLAQDANRVPGKRLELIFPEEMNWPTAFSGDAVFMQRPFNDNHLAIAKYAKQCGLPLWLDYDDDLFKVTPDNPMADVYTAPRTKECITKLLGMADHVSVSTVVLADRFHSLAGGPITVIPNAIDDYRYPEPVERKPKKELLIAWRGLASHQRDLLEERESIVEVARKSGSAHWMFIGYNPWFITEALTMWGYVSPMDPVHYFEFMRRNQPDIVMVPLAETEFNKAKSNIAWLEATWAGALTVAPDWAEWNGAARKYGNGVSFGQALLRTIDSITEMRPRFFDQAVASIKAQYVLSKTNRLRANVLQRLVA